MWAGTLYPITPREALTCLTTLLETLHARMVYMGLYLANCLAMRPVWVTVTNMSTLLSSAICVAVVHSISVTDGFYSLSIARFLMSW